MTVSVYALSKLVISGINWICANKYTIRIWTHHCIQTACISYLCRQLLCISLGLSLPIFPRQAITGIDNTWVLCCFSLYYECRQWNPRVNTKICTSEFWLCLQNSPRWSSYLHDVCMFAWPVCLRIIICKFVHKTIFSIVTNIYYVRCLLALVSPLFVHSNYYDQSFYSYIRLTLRSLDPKCS